MPTAPRQTTVAMPLGSAATGRSGAYSKTTAIAYWSTHRRRAHDYQLHVNGVDHDVQTRGSERACCMCSANALASQGRECLLARRVRSCSVLMDGKLVCSCLVLASSAVGADIVTIEGLSAGENELSDVQAAFLAKGGVQCGFCTPGWVTSTTCSSTIPTRPSWRFARLCLTTCRCTGYGRIFAAVRAVQQARQR